MVNPSASVASNSVPARRRGRPPGSKNKSTTKTNLFSSKVFSRFIKTIPEDSDAFLAITLLVAHLQGVFMNKVLEMIQEHVTPENQLLFELIQDELGVSLVETQENPETQPPAETQETIVLSDPEMTEIIPEENVVSEAA